MNDDDVLSMIRRDIATFSDPATEVVVDRRSAMWHQNRQEMRMTFKRGTDIFPDLIFNDRPYRYVEFMASEHMADLRALADSLCRSIDPATYYVEPHAKTEDGDQEGARRLIKKLSTTQLPFGATQVTFVRAPAGMGKTTVLRDLVLRQARQYLDGQASCLFLYVDAQARSLSRLNEAIATVLQDLRARFTYHAVATLTRASVLIPIIDGFDELLGVGGYGEAFSSLSRFLDELEGRGAIVASARSAFYDYHDVGALAGRVSRSELMNYQIVPVDILPWDRKQVEQYLQESGAADLVKGDSVAHTYDDLVGLLGDDGVQFLRTPFYVASIAQVIKDHGEINRNERVIPQVIDHFIDREKDKLKDPYGQPILDREAHSVLLRMIAEEMWWLETRELDWDSLKTIAELAGESVGLAPHAVQVVVDRIPAYAFLTSNQGVGRRTVSFSHEYYYAFFLGQYIAQQIISDGNISSLMSRSALPTTVGDEVSYAILDRMGSPELILKSLARRRYGRMDREVGRENAGILYSGVIRTAGHQLSGHEIREAIFIYTQLPGSLSDCRFADCSFVGCDLTRAIWTNIAFHNCILQNIKIDLNTTRLEAKGLEIGKSIVGLVIVSGDDSQSIFAPRDTQIMLEKLGVEIDNTQTPDIEISPAAQRHVDTCRRFLGVAARRFYISDDDLSRTGLDRRPEIGVIMRLLEEHELLEEVTLSRRGPRADVRRLTLPPAEILKGEARATADDRILGFWAALQSIK